VQGTANHTGICVSEKLIVLNGEAQIANKWNFDDIPANCFDPEHKTVAAALDTVQQAKVAGMFACHFSRCGKFVAKPVYS
jgi:hypothetical protein